nr:ImmA/IrrE family metallo-endopeptidase [Clostridium paraputrificum]
MKNYKKKSYEEKKKEVDQLISSAENKIKDFFDSPEQIKEVVDYMARFYNYSLRNTFLIQEQFRGALAVGSYTFWKDKGYTVNKGEKGIKILVPNKLSDYFINEKGEEVKLKNANTEEKKLIEQGKIEVIKGRIMFNQGYVFDISQTNAKAEDLPKIFPNRWLDGEVKDYDLMYKAMENIANKIGVEIIEPKEELGAVKGVSYPATKEIALNLRNTQLQNVKTLIHELTHAKLHTMETRDNYSVNAKEFQAELTAYTVCKYFGLDTSEYSFRYINSWTKGIELKDKEKILNEVKETTKEYIEIIEDVFITDKELSLSVEKEGSLQKMKEEKDFEIDKNLNEENIIKSVEVIYSEVDILRKGEKLEYEEVKELYRESIENAVDERVIELKFIVDKDFDYTDEFLISKGGDCELTKVLEQKVDETKYVKSMIESYLNENDMERKEENLNREKGKEQYSEMTNQRRELEMEC